MITIDFNKLPVKPGNRILDIGCGHGRHTSAAVRFKDVVTMGTDIEIDCVVETKNKLKFHEKLGEVQGRWALSVSDIECLPFRNQYFDVIIPGKYQTSGQTRIYNVVSTGTTTHTGDTLTCRPYSACMTMVMSSPALPVDIAEAMRIARWLDHFDHTV